MLVLTATLFGFFGFAKSMRCGLASLASEADSSKAKDLRAFLLLATPLLLSASQR
jgi:hypothetical protein